MNNRTWTDDRLIQAVKEGYSFASVLTQLGLRVAGGNYKTIRDSIDRLQLNTDHWTGQGHLRGKTHNWSPSKPFKDILIKDSGYTSTNKLKHRLLKANLLVYECSSCHLSNWRGKDIVLQLDHINGVNNDHRIENLRLLCPNCHSQTETFCGRNKGKVK